MNTRHNSNKMSFKRAYSSCRGIGAVIGVGHKVNGNIRGRKKGFNFSGGFVIANKVRDGAVVGGKESDNGFKSGDIRGVSFTGHGYSVNVAVEYGN